MSVRISKDGQIIIPQELLEECGLQPDDEVDIFPTRGGLQIRKLPVEHDPVKKVYGIWGTGGSTEEYMQSIRGN